MSEHVWAVYTGGLPSAHPEAEIGGLIHVSNAFHADILRDVHSLEQTGQPPYGCADPGCGEPVFKRGGKAGGLVAAHFSHYSDTACDGGGETVRHLLMKQGIADLLDEQPGVRATIERPLSDGSGVQPDVTVMFDSGHVYYVEVVVTHAPEQHTIDTLGNQMFVVNAKHCKFEDIRETMLAPALVAQHLLEHHDALMALEDGVIDCSRLVTPYWLRNHQRRIGNHNLLFPVHLDRMGKYAWSREIRVEENVVGEEPVYAFEDVKVGEKPAYSVHLLRTQPCVEKKMEWVSTTHRKKVGSRPIWEEQKGEFGTSKWVEVGRKPVFRDEETTLREEVMVESYRSIFVKKKLPGETIPVFEQQRVEVGTRPTLQDREVVTWTLTCTKNHTKVAVLSTESSTFPTVRLEDCVFDSPQDELLLHLREAFVVTAQARLAADLETTETRHREYLGSLDYGGPVWGAAPRSKLSALKYISWSEDLPEWGFKTSPEYKLWDIRRVTMATHALATDACQGARRKALEDWLLKQRVEPAEEYDEVMALTLDAVMELSEPLFALLPEFIRESSKESAIQSFRSVYSITEADLQTCRIRF